MSRRRARTGVGVDGCRGGWVAVRLEADGGWRVELFRDAAALWRGVRDAPRILIDIPIGLRDRGSAERACDPAARRLLGRPRSSSVFRPPCRAVLGTASYADACRVSRRWTGLALSRQAWGIVPRIREIDLLLAETPSARRRLHEAHPELCLWALAGGAPMRAAKRTPAGYRERVRLLRRLEPRTGAILRFAERELRRSDAARDDVVDALALAVSALQPRLDRVPARPERDGRGLPMQIRHPRVILAGPL